ncbi:MAG: translation initiation factor IF-2 [Clostridia bacterium]|nr:translation initiation factor IF-2 [Clostridia bacterium]
MNKIRVYELAKELEISNKSLLEKLQNLDINAKNHMSSLNEQEVKIIKLSMQPDKKQTADLKKEETASGKVDSIKVHEVASSSLPKTKTVDKKNNNKKRKNKSKSDWQRDKQPQEISNVIEFPEKLSVQEIANKLNKSSGEIIKALMNLGIMATINQEVEGETAIVVAEEYGISANVKKEDPEELMVDMEEEENPVDLRSRPPVVTIMGHVDHGKTSLLDAIRQANVTSTEAGGITQHIGAYQVIHNGKKITFLDTPGHEAFTAMRARGAKATDIAILVVAADDGVMPQTVEAINHAKAANVPLIVAVNKIDKPNANPEKVKQELTEHGLVAEEWGGETIVVPVSAKTQEGLDELLEMILLVAEIEEFKANPFKKARGVVIEAELDKGRGPVATVLVHNGTLEVGDVVVAGWAFGKVRAMMDYSGKRVKKAEPSLAVEVLGLSDVPLAGDVFQVVADEKAARSIVEKKINAKKEEQQQKSVKVSLEDFFKQIDAGKIKDLNIIIKGDVQGSVEAIKQSLEKLSTDEVRLNIVHIGVGTISETDIMLASASNAIILGFNVRPDANTRKAADKEAIDIRLYRVIYDAIEDIKSAMSGLLDPYIKENVIGRAEVRAIFKVPKAGNIAGCYVVEGKITRSCKIRVIRNGIVIHEGELDSLKRFKDDAKEVSQGYECGIGVERFNDIKEGDIIEGYVYEEIKRHL